ncbi:MAG: glycosyltransferase [Chitinophagaceae bacterium]|nr:glycosyltransferase [Chitinophagaceae bacterium]
MSVKKILFACAPFDGHFSPLTGLAMHLKNQGHDVRWYTQDYYAGKLKNLDIKHYPFVHADQLNQESMDTIFPERKNINNQIKKLNFDIRKIFIEQGPLYYRDIQQINKEFDFDIMIADVGFVGVSFVKELMKKPVFSIGVFPLTETSKDLAPTGLGLTPAKTFFGRRKQDILRFVANKILFGSSNKLSIKVLREYGIESKNFVFDETTKRSTLVLQSGTPGFEYKRSDLSSNIRFIGPLLPYSQKKLNTYKIERHNEYDKVILVTQGTVEKDVNKILVPTLEAFKNTNTLVIATTGGSGTEELRKKYPQQNFIIEDFIPFGDILPICDVYITNGGYGGVMLGIQHKVPMVVAGVHEGKNEICARVGYFKLGINLRTEKPTSDQIRKAVNEVARTAEYKRNVSSLANEFRKYEPAVLLEKYLNELDGVRMN